MSPTMQTQKPRNLRMLMDLHGVPRRELATAALVGAATLDHLLAPRDTTSPSPALAIELASLFGLHAETLWGSPEEARRVAEAVRDDAPIKHRHDRAFRERCLDWRSEHLSALELRDYLKGRPGPPGPGSIARTGWEPDPKRHHMIVVHPSRREAYLMSSDPVAAMLDFDPGGESISLDG